MSLDSAPEPASASAPTEEVHCPLCGGTGTTFTVVGTVTCDRCGGSGLIEQAIPVRPAREQRAAQIAAAHLSAAKNHLEAGVRRGAAAANVTEAEQVGLEFARAQTHALIAIATTLGGAA